MDRNILENWYYAIWAYNGFSWTNNPNCEGGRHYPDRVISLMAQKKIASDGSLLWEPVSLTALNFLEIDENPHWIDANTPFHYSDLYNAYNKGDNFILTSSPQEMVITNLSNSVKFSVQNIGSTVWNGEYSVVVTFDNGEQYKTNIISTAVNSGEIFDVFIKFPILPNGAHQSTVSMYNDSGVKFGSDNRVFFYYQNDYFLDNSINQEIDEFSIGDKVPYNFVIGRPNFANSFDFYFSLINSNGEEVLNSSYLSSKNILDPFSIIIDANKLRINFSLLLASDINEEPLPGGTYTLNIFVSSSVKNVVGKSGNAFPFCSFSKKFNLKNTVDLNKINIVLLSNYSGDKILVDGMDTGLITPAIVSLELGLHIITVLHGGQNYNYDMGSLTPKFEVICPVFSSLIKKITALDPGEKEIIFTVDNPNSSYSRLFSISNMGFALNSRNGVVYPDFDWLVVSPITYSNGNCNFILSIDTNKIFNIFSTFGNSLTNNLHFTREGLNYTIPVKVNFNINTIPTPPAEDTINGKISAVLDKNKISISFDLSKTLETNENIKMSLTFSGEKDITIVPVDNNKFVSSADNNFDLFFDNIELNNNSSSLLKNEGFMVVSPLDTNQEISIKLTVFGISSNPTLNYSTSVDFIDITPQEPAKLSLSRTSKGVYLSWQVSNVNNYNGKTTLVFKNSKNEITTLATIPISTAAQSFSHIFNPIMNDTYYYSVFVNNDFGKSETCNFEPVNIIAKKYIEFYLDKPYFLSNGKKYLLNKTIIPLNNSYYLEKSNISAAFGLKTNYDSKTGFLTITNSTNNSTLKLKLNSSTAYFNGIKETATFNNIKKNNIYYVSIKYLCEKFKLNFTGRGATLFIKEL
jgi:hypothetical protein